LNDEVGQCGANAPAPDKEADGDKREKVEIRATKPPVTNRPWIFGANWRLPQAIPTVSFSIFMTQMQKHPPHDPVRRMLLNPKGYA
jgi:hypothetical protein